MAALLGSCSSGPEETAGKPEAPAPEKKLVFRGNSEISEGSIRSALRKDLRQMRERGLRKSDVDDLAFEVERLYRNRGYHFARVTYEDSPAEAVLTIQEGPRVLIQEVRISGNTLSTGKELADLLSSRRAGFLGWKERIFVEGEVNALQGAIQDVYRERGYQEIKVDPPAVEFTGDRTGAIITVNLSEGRQYVLRNIDFSGVTDSQKEDLKNRTRYLLDSAYVPRVKFEVKSIAEEYFGEQGHRYAIADVTKEILRDDPEEKEVAVGFRASVQVGPAVRIKEVLVKGNRRTSSSFIKSHVLLKEGDLFNSALDRRSYRRLFNTGIFKEVDLRLFGPEGNPGDTGVLERELVVEVKERSTLEYFGGLGYGSYDLVWGRAGIVEKNLLGRGLMGRAEVRGSFRGAHAILGLTDPWFLQSEWTADLPLKFLYREEESFTLWEQSVRFQLSRRLFKRLMGGAAYRFSLSRVENFTTGAILGEQDNLVLGALGPFLKFDTRDDILLPTRGINSRLFGEVGGPFFGGEIYFYHLGGSISLYHEIFPGTIIAGTFQSEWIIPFSDTPLIPIQERLFSGGESSVRSFQERDLGPRDPITGNPLGGEARNLASLEVRQRIIGNFFLAIFGDYGEVAFRRRDAVEDFRPAVGTGVRYALPIGAVRLDVGFNPDKRENEDLYNIHFAVGLPF